MKNTEIRFTPKFNIHQLVYKVDYYDGYYHVVKYKIMGFVYYENTRKQPDISYILYDTYEQAEEYELFETYLEAKDKCELENRRIYEMDT